MALGPVDLLFCVDIFDDVLTCVRLFVLLIIVNRLNNVPPEGRQAARPSVVLTGLSKIYPQGIVEICPLQYRALWDPI